jgi:hypothetical protein
MDLCTHIIRLILVFFLAMGASAPESKLIFGISFYKGQLDYFVLQIVNFTLGRVDHNMLLKPNILLTKVLLPFLSAPLTSPIQIKWCDIDWWEAKGNKVVESKLGYKLSREDMFLSTSIVAKSHALCIWCFEDYGVEVITRCELNIVFLHSSQTFIAFLHIIASLFLFVWLSYTFSYITEEAQKNIFCLQFQAHS